MAHSTLVAESDKSNAASSAWLRRGVHRYTLLAGVLIAFVGLVTFVAPTDPDVWWHMRNGQLILDSGIPTHDVYSYTAQGRPWLVQEWLTEAIMYTIKSTLGYGVLSLLFGVLQAAGAALVYILLRRMGTGRIPALLLLMLYLVFGAPTWGVRPQVLTPVFLGAFYLVLLAYRQNPARSRLLWVLPPIMLLWANMHASYFMGVALIGAFLVGEFANSFIYRPERPTPLKPLLFVLGASLVATLANPYFIELWTYPLTYALHGTSNPLLRYTQEWQSPNFHEPASLLFGLSLLLLAVFGIARPLAASEDTSKWRVGLTRYIDITTLILLVAFSVLALQAVRLVPLYGLIALPILGGALASAWPALSSRDEAAPEGIEARLNLPVGAVIIAALAFVLLQLPQAQTGPEPRTDTGFVYPVQAAGYIQKLNRPVRMYNDFAWGGYLISRLYPQRLVFIDGRADMYREGIFDNFITVQNVAPGWREVLSHYAVDLALIAPDTPLDYALAHEPGWSREYKDAAAVIYSKNK